jgi:uncharacterized protein
MELWLIFVGIGIIAGLSSGLFGIGGGIVVVPMLMYWAGFSPHKAIGTSILLLLPPLGLAAAIEFYRNGHTDVQAGLIIAVTMFCAAWFGARIANKIRGPYLRLFFSVLVLCVGVYLVYNACNHLGWIGPKTQDISTIELPNNGIDTGAE